MPSYKRMGEIPRARRQELAIIAKRASKHLMPAVPDLRELQYKELCYVRIVMQRQLQFALPPRPKGDVDEGE